MSRASDLHYTDLNHFNFLGLKNRVQLGDHDLGPVLDGLKRPSDYVLAGKDCLILFQFLYQEDCLKNFCGTS